MDNGGNNRESPSKRPMLTDDDRKTHRSVPSSSSVHQVLSNDDLLVEILLRLPVISLFFFFKSVSKRWLSLITSPAFLNLHVSRFPNVHPPCGFFLQKIKYSHNNIYENNFVSLDTRIPPGKKKSSAFRCFGSEAGKVEVLQSCNGLVLCVITHSRSNVADKIYVYNPSINMFKMLPLVDVDGLKLDNFRTDSMRLAFDPKKSPHYKVVHTRETAPGGDQQGDFVETQIYSSETGCWRIGDTFPLEWFCGYFETGVYWNDAIHWFCGSIFDIWINRVRHFKLDVEHPHDTTTKLPKTLDKNRYKELFEFRGCLLLASAGNNLSKHLEIYEMRNGYSGWSVTYIVDFEHSSMAAFLKTQKMSDVFGFHFDVLFIVVGEREEEPYVVMKLGGKVVKYNLLLKTPHTLCDSDSNINSVATEFRTFPFIASFAVV